MNSGKVCEEEKKLVLFVSLSDAENRNKIKGRELFRVKSEIRMTVGNRNKVQKMFNNYEN